MAKCDHMKVGVFSKMVVVGPTPPPIHGVATMNIELIAALSQIGRFAGHVDTRDPRPLSTIGRFDATNVMLGLKHSWRLWRLLGRERDAAVYLPISQTTWGFIRDSVLIALTRIRKRRVLIHLNGGYFQTFYRNANIAMRALIRLVLRQVREAWVLTPSLRAQFDGLVDPHRLRCVGNVVRDPKISRTGKVPADSTFRILYLSNLLPEKGCFELLKALSIVDRQGLRWEVRLVGAGSPAVERALREEISGIANDGLKISLEGELDGLDKDRQYQWADIFVFPTYYRLEGQPLVLLEALASGLPMVSTRHAGIPETVRHEREGLLTEPRDPGGLAAAMSRLSKNRGEREQLGERARRHYESAYSPGRLLEDLETCFDGNEQGPDSSEQRPG